MNKVNGTQASFAAVREDGSRIAICYGLKQLSKDLYEWFEVYLPKKQMPQLTFDVVKQAILADINDKVKTAIISGFVWNDKPVWFSEENQLNFSQAVVPVTLKIGEQEDLKVAIDAIEEAPQNGFAVKKGENADLLKMFNEGLQKIRDNGKYDEIIAEYE